MSTQPVPPPPGSGLFVAFEGGDGAGKSTQAALLEQWLTGAGREVVRTREPGGTVVGRAIREVVLHGDHVAPRAEALLFAADRAHHVAEVVRPALERGAVVLTDRYVDSSLAYQGAGRALGVDEVARLSQWATEGLKPDLVVLLDVDPLVGLSRAGETPDRIEAESLDFHERVRQGFLDLAGADHDRYLVIPADQPSDRVLALVQERLSGVVHQARTPVAQLPPPVPVVP